MSEKDGRLLIKRGTLNLRRKYGRTKKIDIIERDAFIPKNIENELKEEIQKKRVILATDLAVQYDVRVSTVKRLLEQYEKEGLIELFDPSLRLKIYVPK